jgi:pilus assembly protein CpaF
MLDDAQAERLRAVVLGRRNVLICGPAGSGKTSLLAALMAEVPPIERIVTVEDVAEIVVDHPHVVGLETRQPNTDGAGGVGLAALVRETLRMRPDRIVVGECRGAEIAELLSALNTGHDGGAGTVHCADPDALGARLEALGALAGLSPAALRAQALAAIDVVVQLGRRDGMRHVERIGSLAARADGSLGVVDP